MITAIKRRFRVLLLVIKSFLEKPLIQISFIIISSFIFSYYSINDFKNQINAYISPSILDLLDDHLVFIIIFALILTLLPYILNFLKKLEGDKLPSLDVLHSMNTGFNEIVDSKCKRFENFYTIHKTKKIFPEHVFSEITQPDQQIALLTQMIYLIFQNNYPDSKFKVRLIDVDKNNPIGWAAYAPKTSFPRTDINKLRKKNSAIKYCLKKKDLVIIENIVQAEKRSQYVMSIGDELEVGSLICFPVSHAPTNSYPYVISVSAEKFFFIKEKRDMYLWILNQFSARIQLEHTLKLIKKEMIHDNKQPI